MSEIDVALKAIVGAAGGYDLYRRYYEGDHRLAFATEKYRSAFGGLFSEFADNLCPRVVDALADRLQIVGFGVEEGDPAAADDAMALWTENRMDQRAGQCMQEALIEGDSYMLVWPNQTPGTPGDGRPTLYAQSAAEMYVEYDPERPGTILWAAKLWNEPAEKRWRMNVYYPDRIEKWATVGRATSVPTSSTRFEPYTEDNAPWPIPNEWGVVPVFHFANNTRRMGLSGASELKAIVPLQDALNKAVTDMLVTMEFSAFRQRWVTGIEIRRDPVTGALINPWEPGADRVWFGSENAKFGEFSQTDLTQFLAVQDNFRAEIARVSATPLHYFMLTGGTFPSGEAMKTAEAPFTAKVSDRQITFGNVWEDVMALALRMIERGGEDLRLTTIWKDNGPQTMQAAPTSPPPPAMPQDVSMPIMVSGNGGSNNGR